MFKHILCPTDGSEHAGKALAIAIDLARDYKADLTVAHVMMRHAVPEELMAYARSEGLAPTVTPEIDRLQALAGRLEYSGAVDDSAVSTRVLVEMGQMLLDSAKRDAELAGIGKVDALLLDGDAGGQILRCIAERDVDCVVMGSRGMSDLKGLFLGSVSHKVVNRAECTCIAVK